MSTQAKLVWPEAPKHTEGWVSTGCIWAEINDDARNGDEWVVKWRKWRFGREVMSLARYRNGEWQILNDRGGYFTAPRPPLLYRRHTGWKRTQSPLTAAPLTHDERLHILRSLNKGDGDAPEE